MGYTHYWYRPVDEYDLEAFDKFAAIAKAIIETAQDAGIALADRWGLDLPEITDRFIGINGIGEDSHESFYWPDIDQGLACGNPGMNDWTVESCKTAGKPYDTVVTALLIAAKFVYRSYVKLQSDGTWEDWLPGRDLYTEATGWYPTDCVETI